MMFMMMMWWWYNNDYEDDHNNYYHDEDAYVKAHPWLWRIDQSNRHWWRKKRGDSMTLLSLHLLWSGYVIRETVGRMSWTIWREIEKIDQPNWPSQKDQNELKSTLPRKTTNYWTILPVTLRGYIEEIPKRVSPFNTTTVSYTVWRGTFPPLNNVLADRGLPPSIPPSLENPPLWPQEIINHKGKG